MTLKNILKRGINKDNFQNLNGYLEFCDSYLEYISKNLQATIVSQNETHYNFYQYGKEGKYQITRPINSTLMYDANTFSKAKNGFQKLLKNVKGLNDVKERQRINNVVYTIQQSVGAALDALPAGQSNIARKLNGDLFEHLIRLILKEIGVEAKSGTVQVPIMIDGEKAFDMGYQHDLIVKKHGEIKVLGSVKTSSKDRVDKIFIDKFLYSKLTETMIPHIAIFLNDVQRKNTAQKNKYGISATFLPGHFKAYTVKLNPLDGVYYCDVRPNMLTEKILKDHIKTFDNLLCEDIWKFI